MSEVIKWAKEEPVLLISSAAALVTCCIVPPSVTYAGYLNLRVLSLLFCLMLVVAGLAELGVFSYLAAQFVNRAGSMRTLILMLVLVCFFSSMLITNDVALITFVPFSLTVLLYAGHTECAIYTVVLETVAANLGSMLTPLGNPQNLYLYAHYKLSAGAFFSVTVPVTALSLLLLCLLTLPIEPRPVALLALDSQRKIPGKKLLLYLALFGICLLAVFDLLPYIAALALVAAAVFVADRARFAKVDYSLLLTFVAFFVFVGNLARIEPVRLLIEKAIRGREFLGAVALSQVISNVPAAVMLSGFTEKGRLLVAGSDIGGLGTLVASLASLISFKIYCKSDGARPRRYLAVFSGVNFALLVILCAFNLIFIS